MASFNTAPATTAPVQNNRAPATAFINIAVPVGNGRTKKIGYIALDSSDPDQVKIAERLEANPELLAKFMANLVVDFRMNIKTEAAAGDIDAMFA